MNKVIKLKKPIEAHGEQIAELNLTEPCTSDIIELGHPVKYDKDGCAIVDTQVIARYIIRLGNIPRTSVIQMDKSDFAAATGEIVSFLGTETPDE